jgi:hypothetical protein
MATRSIRSVSREKTDDLLNKIVTSWPHARPADAAMGAQMGDSGLEGTATVSQDYVGAGSPAAAHSHPAGSGSQESRAGGVRASSSSVTAYSSSLRKRSLEAGNGAVPSGNGVRRSGGEGGVGGEEGACPVDAAHDASRANVGESETPPSLSLFLLAKQVCAYAGIYAVGFSLSSIL